MQRPRPDSPASRETTASVGRTTTVTVTIDIVPQVDVALVGGGVMSATLATLLLELEPSWTIEIVERLDAVAQESSSAWNNAGTGHAALCELNYTPEQPDGRIDISKAVRINEQFSVSGELWEHLIATGRLHHDDFRVQVPHITFVRGEQDVDYLRRRHAALITHPRFAGMEFSDDPDTLAQWMPIVMAERGPGPVAATRAPGGYDVDFGALTDQLMNSLIAQGARLRLGREVRDLRRETDGSWQLLVQDSTTGAPSVLNARFVFVGAGGGALHLLQRAGIPEIRGYGGFPISGQFLRTRRPELVEAHHAKVYGKAAFGSPPMSVPHLDAREVDGERTLLFGPYAGWTMKFLKFGSTTDLLRTIRPHNLIPMLAAGMRNLDLVKYLATEVFTYRAKRMAVLRGFLPTAEDDDWELITAGQRVQVIKRGPGGGVLEFGTELVTAADGSIGGLLGASPGASTAASTMVELLGKCFPDRMPRWRPQLLTMMPTLAEIESDATKSAA